MLVRERYFESEHRLPLQARAADDPRRVEAHALPADGLLANGTDSYRGRAVMDEAVHVSLALRREANNRLRHQLFGPGDPLRGVW